MSYGHQQKHRWLIYCLMSLVFHTAWFALPQIWPIFFKPSPRHDTIVDPLVGRLGSGHFVKLTINRDSKKPKISKAIIAEDLERKPQGRSGVSYEHLLPKFSGADPSFSESSHQATSGDGPESRAQALVAAVRSSQHIEAFAEDVRARVDVPNKIYHIRRSGSARATVKKDDNGQWNAEVFGESSYARAILSTALNSIPANSLGLYELNRTHWRRVDVDFSFEWREKVFSTPEAAGPDVWTRDNQIKIAVIHYGTETEINQNLRRAMVFVPLATGGGMIDIIGFYNEFLKRPDPSPRSDRGIQKLETSPGFVKRLITVPLGH